MLRPTDPPLGQLSNNASTPTSPTTTILIREIVATNLNKMVEPVNNAPTVVHDDDNNISFENFLQAT